MIEADGLDAHIRYHHTVTGVSWSSPDRRWTVDVERADTGERLRFTTGFLWMCQGYYNHDEPYQPEWPGTDRFDGTIVHPQQWPDDLDVTGKRVIVIGSGSTASTLIPAIAKTAEHVTMLQRSPSYYYPSPIQHELATQLKALDIPPDWLHEIMRRQYAMQFNWLARASLDTPDELHTFLMDAILPLLPEGFDIEKHLTPRYRPWQQRIAITPRRRPVRGAARGQGLDGHRHHRHVHRARHQGLLRRGDPRRHRRDRHRVQPVGLRRRAVHRRRGRRSTSPSGSRGAAS